MEGIRYSRRLETVLVNIQRKYLDGKLIVFQAFQLEFNRLIQQLNELKDALSVVNRIEGEKINDFISQMECEAYEPHCDTAFHFYQQALVFFLAYVSNLTTDSEISISQKANDVKEQLAKLLEAYHLEFGEDENISTKAEEFLKRRKDQFQCDSDILPLTDSFIAETVISNLMVFLFACSDYKLVSNLIEYVDNAIIKTKQTDDGVVPSDILERLSNLPQHIYQAYCYYLFSKKIIYQNEYFGLVNSIKSRNSDTFLSFVLDKVQLFQFFARFYDYIVLTDDIKTKLIKTKFEPNGFIQIIRCFVGKRSVFESDRATKKNAILLTGINHEWAQSFSVIDIELLVSDIMRTNTITQERYSLYCELYKRWRNRSYNLNSTDELVSDNMNNKNDDTNNPVEELNCKYPDSIDDFIDYLVWRGYIKEGDQSSFKYYVFGGQKPSDYRDVSFNFERSLSGSTMLGVIVLQLRKKNPQLVELFNKTINKTNCNIGTNKESTRIFVDLSLFFPSLWLRIRDTNTKEKNQIVEKNLKKLVQRLKDNDEYKSCSSVLEFIKKFEKKNVQYWVVSTKVLD